MRWKTGAMAAVLVLAAIAAPAWAVPPDGDIFAPRGVSVVVPDIAQATRAWTDVLGVSAKQLFEPQGVIYRPDVEGDRAAVGPRIALFDLANMNLTLHQPPAGRTYWRGLLDRHGMALYRIFLAVTDLPATVAYFQAKGGKLTLGDPDRTPYANVNLWPRYGFALELYVAAPTPAQLANAGTLQPILTPPEAPPIADGSRPFADNPVTSIGFVVPNLKRAIRDYTALFGMSAASAIPVSRPAGYPATTVALRLPNSIMLELNAPRGGPSLWRSHLGRHGPSLFSIGFKVRDVRAAADYLAQKGGRLAGGSADGDQAVFDFESSLGAVIEVHE